MVYCKLIFPKRKSGKKAKKGRKHPKRGRKGRKHAKKAKKGGIRACVRRAKTLKAAKKCCRKY